MRNPSASLQQTSHHRGRQSCCRGWQVRVLGLLLPTLLLLGVPGLAAAFAGGTGTAADPYQVATAADLNNVRYFPEAHFRQVAAIELGEAPWNQNGGWVPIGSDAARFTGHYDGNGLVIRHLSIYRPTTNHQGLFGYTENATIAGVILETVSIQGQWSVGGLAGRADNTSIRHAFVTDGVVTGYGDVGGLVGFVGSGTSVADTASRSAVTGNNDVGGLVGELNASTVDRSYSTGAVAGNSYVGGLVGYNPNGRVSNGYWDTETSGQTGSAGGTGLTTAQMRQQASYRNYNFNTLWRIDEGTDTPVFRDLSGYAQPQAVALADLPGSGTPSDPYLIATLDQLNALRLNPAASYRLSTDIDASATVVWDAGRGWTPLGTNEAHFTGQLDGAGHTIRYLALNRPTADYQGLFGVSENASLAHVTLQAVNVQGASQVGGLVGQALTTAIEAVWPNGALIAIYDHVGAVAGRMIGGSLHQAFSEASVMGRYSAAGLVGRTDGTTIRHAFTTGVVTGNSDVGGLVGFVGSGTSVADTASRSAVTAGNDDGGGLVGELNASTVDRSYSIGTVAGNSYVGGLVGYNPNGQVSNSYWDTETSGRATSAGGSGRTTDQMTYPYDPTTYSDWDFAATWAEDTASHNAGYPYLQALGPGFFDQDQDSIPDAFDNCPAVVNPAQLDTDHDGLGDACDPDDDNDGVPDGQDAFPLDPHESVDTDGDGIGNNADPDDDNDAVLDGADNCPLVANPDQADVDGDGVGDACDQSQTGCRTGTLLIAGTTFGAGTHALDAEQSLATQGSVRLLTGATVSFRAPWHRFGPGLRVALGARLGVRSAAVTCGTPASVAAHTETRWVPTPAAVTPAAAAPPAAPQPVARPDALPAWMTERLVAHGLDPRVITRALLDPQGQWLLLETTQDRDPADRNGASDIYRFDLVGDTLALLSRTPTGRAGNGPSRYVAADATGDWVVFQSDADDLVADDANGVTDIFLREVAFGATRRLTATTEQAAAHPALDADGQALLYDQPGADGQRQILLEGLWGERPVAALSLAQDATGMALDNHHPAISADGRYVAYLEERTVNGQPVCRVQVYDRDLGLDQTQDCPEALAAAREEARPAFSADGTVVEWALPGAEEVVIVSNPLFANPSGTARDTRKRP